MIVEFLDQKIQRMSVHQRIWVKGHPLQEILENHCSGFYMTEKGNPLTVIMELDW